MLIQRQTDGWSSSPHLMHHVSYGTRALSLTPQGIRTGYPESKLLRDMAFGLLQPAVQAALPQYRFAPTPRAVSLPSSHSMFTVLSFLAVDGGTAGTAA